MASKRLFFLGCFLLFFASIGISAEAGPLMFSDRDAFESYTRVFSPGYSNLLTLDAPDTAVLDFSTGRYETTYGDLIKFSFDMVGGYNPFDDGIVSLGWTVPLSASGEVLVPVTAFGFDIVRGDYSYADVFFGKGGLYGDTGLTISLAGLNFLGFASSTPFDISIAYIGHPVVLIDRPPFLIDTSLPYAIDNVLIKTPEPDSFTFFTLALLVVLGSFWLRTPSRTAAAISGGVIS